MMTGEECRKLLAQHGIKKIDLVRMAQMLGDKRPEATLRRNIDRAIDYKRKEIPWYAEFLVRLVTTDKYCA